tara:strand:- start:93302 stop:95716 length:2415 start_codon:yes stop_codon:yes gene_type:complete
MSILKNELSKFATHNYRWTFSALAAGEYNNPSSYRDTGGSYPIIRSGGLPDKPVTTFIEDTLKINVEYYIDNVSVEYLATPTPGTGVTSATQISFSVTEPYSIGLFFQSLVIATQKGGFVSHLTAPYALMCEFIGYNDTGIVSTSSKRVLAINLTNISMKINEGGCTYEIEAIPFNHIALLDTIQVPTTDMELIGDTVAQLLGSGEQSLAAVLNNNQTELFKSAQRLVKDEYVINFPTDIASNTRSGTSTFGSTIETLRTSITPAGPVRVDTSSRANINIDSNSNYIGNSPIIQSFTAYGTNPFAKEDQTWDPINQIFSRTNLTIDSANRIFTFSSGTRIQKIIEDVILTSEWSTYLENFQVDEADMVDWFKIDTKVDIIDPSEAAIIGRPAMRFTYTVIPYKVHKSIFSSVSEPQDYSPNITKCVKAYNYIYTGLNDDIISFDLEFNSSFFKPVGNLASGNQANNISGSVIDLQRQSGLRIVEPAGFLDSDGTTALNAPATVAPMTFALGTGGGATINTNKKALAELFSNNVLNSDVENVTVNLKIWGDPYYMADNDAGNYRPGPGQLNIAADGQIDWQRSEVDILLNFKSGIDYGNNGLIGLDPASMFSGIYKIVIVKSSFDNGTFTQELELLRRPNQTKNSIEITQALVDAFTNDGNVSAVNQIVNQNISRTGQFNPYMISLPPELNQFTQLGDLALIRDTFQIPDNAISQAIAQAQALISIGNQIQSNLANTLGALGLGGGALGALTGNLGSVLGAAGQASATFAGLEQNVSALATSIRNPMSGAFGGNTPPSIPRIKLF